MKLVIQSLFVISFAVPAFAGQRLDAHFNPWKKLPAKEVAAEQDLLSLVNTYNNTVFAGSVYKNGEFLVDVATSLVNNCPGRISTGEVGQHCEVLRSEFARTWKSANETALAYRVGNGVTAEYVKSLAKRIDQKAAWYLTVR